MKKYLLALVSILLLGCGSPVGEDTINLAIGEYEGLGGAATGTVIINPTSGQVDTTVADLPALTGEMYEGWLAGGGESPLSTGRFNTDENGVGSISVNVGDISTRSYTFFVLTIEPEPDPDPKPDPRHSIGADLPAK